MSVTTKKLQHEVNAETLRSLFERHGLLADFGLGPLQGVANTSQVTCGLPTPAGRVEVVVEAQEPGREAFARGEHLAVSYLQAPPVDGWIEGFREFAQRVVALDVGAARLRVSSHLNYLPVFAEKDFVREPFWTRELLDARLRAVPPIAGRHAGVGVVVTQSCQMDCFFCPRGDRVGLLMPSESGGAREHFDDLVYQLEAGRRLGATRLWLSGGDVLLFPYALELLERARALGYTYVLIESLGQAMADPAFAAAVAATGLAEIAAPIYGTTASQHDACVNTPGAFDKLVQGLDHARALGGPRYRLHTILLQRSLGQLAELIDFCDRRFGLPLRVTSLYANRDGEDCGVSDMVPLPSARPTVAAHPLHFVELPLCQFPAEVAYELYRVRRQSPEFGLTPLSLYDLGMPDRSEHPGARARRVLGYPAECDGCVLRAACPGLLGLQRDFHGSADLRAFDDPARLAAAMQRTGEPFPEVAGSPEEKRSLAVEPW